MPGVMKQGEPKATAKQFKVKQLKVKQPKEKTAEKPIEMQQTEVKQLKVKQPKVKQPKEKTVEKPIEMQQTEVKQPKVKQPKVKQPKEKTTEKLDEVEHPKVKQPKVKTMEKLNEVERPKVKQPKEMTVEKLKEVEQPKVKQPKVKQPKVKQSKVKQPKEDQAEEDQAEEDQAEEDQADEKPAEDKKLAYKKRVKDNLMQKCIDTLLSQHQKANDATDDSGRKSVFADAGPNTSKVPVNLVIQSFKIPFAVPRSLNKPLHPKIFRFSLPHSLTDGASGVLLVTKDYPKKGKPTAISNAHYLDMITTAGCNHLITEIMSVSQLAAEYSEQEARKELCRRIDVVLCDQPCVKIVPRLLGHHFLKAKKFPISVKLNSNKLKKELENKLSTTAHKMTFRNTESSLTFGHTAQSPEQLFDNLTAAMTHLCGDQFPGSWPNVKSLYLSAGLKTRVPLFISRANISSVPTVALAVKREFGEHITGDFGFGPIRLSSTLNIVDYSPMSDDEDAFIHGNKYNFRGNKAKKAENEAKLAKKKAEKRMRRKESKAKRKALEEAGETAPPAKKRKTSSSGSKKVTTPGKDNEKSEKKLSKKTKMVKKAKPAKIHTTVLEEDFMQ